MVLSSELQEYGSEYDRGDPDRSDSGKIISPSHPVPIPRRQGRTYPIRVSPHSDGNSSEVI